ncbi:hypothetical protein NMG60_11014308 [Bertholletia excelsa]
MTCNFISPLETNLNKEARMAKPRHTNLLLLFLLFTLVCAANVTRGTRIKPMIPSGTEFLAQRKIESRRLMIGSTAPTCTYNECRGCKYKCRAEQVPVEGNDPINSPYHYKCVCHR